MFLICTIICAIMLRHFAIMLEKIIHNMPINGRLTGVNETAVCMVCGACAVPATNLREWSMRPIHVVVIAARRSLAVASGR